MNIYARAVVRLALVLGACGALACDQKNAPSTAAGTTSGTSRKDRGALFPAAELSSLEAPDRAQWQQPERVMDALSIADGSRVADFGAGGGWFTSYLSRRVGPNGVVYAEDIQPEMIESIERRRKTEGWKNVEPVLGTADDPRLPSGLHAVLLVDTYPQLANPVGVLSKIALSLAPGGRVGIVDFKNDGAGGPGPRQEDRIAPEAVIKDAERAGLTLQSQERFLRYQYLLVFRRTTAATAPEASGRER